ncbi:MAG: hypothetical protein WA323_27860 [Candidatus Nitrosopolaris sp.]
MNLILIGIAIALMIFGYLVVTNGYESNQAQASCSPGFKQSGSFWSYPPQPRCMPE